MAVTVTATASSSVAANITGAPNLGTSQAALNQQLGVALTNGTGAGQADTVWFDQRTLTASSNETLDLNGSLRDALNDLVSLVRVKVLVISAATTNTNNVVVGGGSTTFTGMLGATTHTMILRPGACMTWFVGNTDATAYTLTAGSSDLLQIANSSSGSSVVYNICVIGCSA
jgi:hypothetical protein